MENNETTPKYFIQVQMQTLKGLGLNSTDKLVYGTIYTMLNVTGKCFMSNAAIAEGLELKPKTVSKSISKLAGAGLLNVKLIYKEDSKQIDKRYITLSDYSGGGMLQKSHRVSDKNSIPMLQKSEGNRLPNRLDEYISSSSGDDFVDEKPVNNQAFTSYERLWGFPNAIAREDLSNWINNYSDELVNYAIEIAGRNNVTSRGAYKYLDKILTTWSNEKVTTVEQAKKQNEEHNNRIDREFKSR
ncbi:DnaD domain protein, partial [Apilactobacillus kunkeei]|uniref:DnaD domain protein n=1 Tax=Apilactobacillus kunkeei TaxID=148814 RepID=UPI00200B6AF3